MNAKTSRTPRRGCWAAPGMLRPIVSAVALGGLVVWAAGPGGFPPGRGPFRPYRFPAPFPAPAPAPGPFGVMPRFGPGGRFVVPAPTGIDERIMVAAPRGIDDAMVCHPDRLRLRR